MYLINRLQSLVPLKQPNDYSCGPTCVRMVAAYYGISLTDEKAEAMCRCNENGCTNEDMAKALTTLNLYSFVLYDSSVTILEMFIKKNIPVIVEYWYEGWGHSAVVISIDKEEKDTITLAEPYEGKLIEMPLADFHRIWFGFESYAVTKDSFAPRTAIVTVTAEAIKGLFNTFDHFQLVPEDQES